MKAILVIDMPNSCDSCRFCVNTYLPIDNGYVFPKCVAKDFGIDLNKKHLNEVHKSCPLKPLPQKKEVEAIETIDDFMQTEITSILNKCVARIQLDTELLLVTGYNTCIDEILGEEE